MLERPDYLKIGKPTPNCAACGKPLAVEDRLASILLEAEPGNETASDAAPPPEPAAPPQPQKHEEEEAHFTRRDYCTTCWNAIKEQAYFSFWIGRRSPSDLPARKLTRAERNVALAALFDSLAERGREEATDFSTHLFFLAHLLMKFKILKWMPSAPHPETGETMLRFLRPQTGEEIFVRDVEMTDETVLRIKEEIEAYLQQTTGQAIRI